MAKLLCPATSWEKLAVALVAALLLRSEAEDEARSLTASGITAVCEGFGQEFEACPNLTPCTDCIPIDCSFGEWEDWYNLAGCIGLCFRERKVGQQNNECGKPCTGAKTESKSCPEDGCGSAAEDCTFFDWEMWSSCVSDIDQRVRTRSIKQLAGNRGTPCTGALKETRPCSAPETPIDCLFSDWGSWSTCSDLCGGGHRTRARRVYRHAAHGGKPCTGNTSELAICNTGYCAGNSDCLLSSWSEWAGCDNFNPMQRFRSRDVQNRSTGGGRACMEHLKETKPCPVHHNVDDDEPKSCHLSNWATWSSCSKSCDGGQMFRHRNFPHGGSARCRSSVIRETQACNTDACHHSGKSVHGTDCQFESWSSWSSCSEDCGLGKKERTRTIGEQATNRGAACSGAIREVIGCLGVQGATCGAVDCVWGDWGMWAACSATCGGGLQNRDRAVATSPLRGGMLCDPLPKTEVMSCATEKCDHCVDGTWSAWSQWSECSMSCDHGVRDRRRIVAELPNHCGRAPFGKDTEVQVCTGLEPCVADRDCFFAAWGDWSNCCPDCFGVRKRHREIQIYSQGRGKPCADPVEEVEACNPGVGEPVPVTCQHVSKPRPCELSSWTPWTKCTVTCGGGQSSRQRNIVGWPDHHGQACAAPLFETQACSTQRCTPKICNDCLWGAWSEWSQCGRCGSQRERKRSIARMPNYCGKRCESRNAQETSNCSSSCESGQFCTWASWTSFSGCPTEDAGCGPHTQRRHRFLHYVETLDMAGYIFEGSGNIQCSGTESEVQPCPFRSCIPECSPEECKFADWTEWSNGACDGLCERKRVVERNARCGAEPCKGALLDTKTCPTTCNLPMDCKLSAWSSWTACHEEHGQMFRTRSIARPTMYGGATCTGSLKETLPCFESGDPVRACTVTDWSPWSACKESCGDSWKARNRFIHSPASGGGEPCSNSLEETASCNHGKCPPAGTVQDCTLASWGEWGMCRPDEQQLRDRAIARPARNGGKACHGHMTELRHCPPQDCKLSDWTPWDVCTASCAGGQQQRVQQVDRPNRHGGLPCPSSTNLKEVRACAEDPCDSWRDCHVSHWSTWAPCSTSCGVGQQTRTRVVNQVRRMDGEGCFFPLVQTRQCPAQSTCPVVDCVWGSWTHWSTCSLTCGGGQQLRHRSIKVMPQLGGQSCEALPKEEMQPCNLESCKAGGCKDGEWGSWSSWGECSASCQGGVSWRWRKISEMANSCGKPPSGPDREYQSCNANVTCHDEDCQFGQWEDWSGCTAPCNGIKRRSRYIKVFGFGSGSYCKGALKETAPCHPSEGNSVPPECQVNGRRDCEFSEWVEGPCSATCGGGHVDRTRHIQVEPIGVGMGCNGPMKEKTPCSTQACPDAAPQCQWGDWSDWGACDKCGGERKRSRHIQQPPAGGQVCDPGSSEELGQCPRTCDATGMACSWDSWEAWSTCSATCGSGTRQRRRGLVLKAGGALPDAITLAEQQQRLREWELQTQNLEQKRFQELALAALLGSCAVAAAAIAVVLLRMFSSSWLCHRSPARDTQSAVYGRDDHLSLLQVAGRSE